ncbi:mechanosensitive ion channel family protein [Clostridium sp. D2Q-14]|uniref:mechanosensitive ion channel family protein n=1 Tax=Anaeromonas gelatinilytica TaxID=2683194 RepID=UPI00193C7D8F|nr:mechanosensitive ion channel family protein [Anaeromonas gelatinilytica]MBS4534872.1 mechanosensitive ion channel family protein [Anaeromonas gelatinilytica]
MRILNLLVEFFDNNFIASFIELGISIVIFVLFLILSPIITNILFKIVRSFTKKSKIGLDDDMVESFKKPLKIFIIFVGLYIALIYLPFSEGTENSITKLFRVSIIILITWGLYNAAGTYGIIHEKIGSKLNIKSQRILKPLLIRVIRIIIIAIAVAIIVEEFGYSISAFIAGLGIGGIAIAMAAQDTLSNAFGGMAIIMDRPFDIGDWIVGAGIEGIVEDINFRSTKVRTFEKALVSIPNSKISKEAITNFSQRGIRRVKFYLGLEYSTTSEKIEKVVEKINSMLKKHSKVDDELIITKFEVFNDSSLDILIQYYAKTSDYEEFLSIQENINFKIINILEEENVGIAFPSTSIYFANKLESNN